MDLTRTMIIGSPGSGKTTLSNALGKMLARNVVHLDSVLWDENWQEMPYEKRKIIHDEIISHDEWIIDGMWTSHVADRFSRATTVVYLDYSRVVCTWRVMRRVRKWKGKQRDDMAKGCVEKRDKQFLKYVWHFNKEVKPTVLALVKKYESDVCIVHLTNTRQTKKFLRDLQRENICVK